jgi:hypothetical protein
MAHAKQVSKRKRRTKAVTALGVAGLLSLTGGASAENVDLAKDTSTENAAAHHEITLEEEEISDVSLGTFYLFDKEDAGTHHPGIQIARGCRGCGGGCRGCRGCARGCRGCRGCGGCGGCGGWCFSVGGFGVCGRSLLARPGASPSTSPKLPELLTVPGT